MRVLFVHERFGALAGAEANLYLTAREFKRRCHTVGIIYGQGTGNAEADWQQTFAERFPLNGRRSDCVRQALARFSPDIFYVHKMADLEVIETIIDSGLPAVRMVHDHDLYCMRSYKYDYFTRKICQRPAGLHCLVPCGAFIGRNRQGWFPLRWVSYLAKKREIELNRRFRRIVAVSNYMREELLRNGFDPRKIEIHPPVPPMGDPGLRTMASDQNLIIFAGQIIRGKGVDLLLKSLALIKTPFECVILGDGGHRAFCEKLSKKLGLTERVHFLGFVPQEQLKDFYGECSVMALSSVWPEPFATIGMEVMRYGIPVVAFEVGGIPDWLAHEDNGFLVRAGDVAEYARRLEQLLTDKALARQMGARGREMVDKKFSFAKYMCDLEEMFTSVMKEG